MIKRHGNEYKIFKVIRWCNKNRFLIEVLVFDKNKDLKIN